MVSGQSPITNEMYLINKKRDERNTGDGTLGKDDFLKILITQLQNQDPTNPMQDNEFIAQMAQFSALEQTMNLAKSFEKFAMMQNESQLIQYNTFIGKNVKWHDVERDQNGNVVLGEDGKPIIREGKSEIIAVKFIDGSVVFSMDNGMELTPGNISEVLAAHTGGNRLVEASMLIGKNVSYQLNDEEKSGTIVSVSNKGGKLEYILNDDSRISEDQLLSISQ